MTVLDRLQRHVVGLDERAREEWEELGRMSYTGGRADLVESDVVQIRALVQDLGIAVAVVPLLIQAARAAEQYETCADCYRRCLEDVQDGIAVRGLAEAKVSFDVARDALRAALAVLAGSTPRMSAA